MPVVLSIRRALFLAFATVALAVAGVLVATAVLQNLRGQRELATAIAADVRHAAEARIHGLLDPIEARLATDLRRAHAGRIPLYDATAVKDLLLPVAQSMKSVGSLMVGDEAGHQILLMRWDALVQQSPLLQGRNDLPPVVAGRTQYFTRDFRPAAWGERSEWTLWDEAGRSAVAQWSVPLPDYDPRQRAWHVQALAQLRAVEAGAVARADRSFDPSALITWTDVYPLFTSRTPGISASAATRAPDGTVVIVAYDLLLDELSAFTRTSQPTPRGKLFACTDRGELVGLPEDPRYEVEAARRADLLAPMQQASPLLRAWYTPWRERSDDHTCTFTFDHAGEEWWGSGHAIPLREGRNLWVGTALPERDLLALAGYDTRRQWTAAIGGLLLALALAAWIASWFSRPLRALVHESRRIGRLDLAERPVPASSLHEVQELGSALAAMRTALRSHLEERDFAQQALVESEARFRAAFEQAAVGMSLVDPSGAMIQVNDRLCAILGRTREEVLRLRFSDFTHPDDRAADHTRVQRLLAGGTDADQWDKRYVHESGRIVHVRVATRLRRYDDGTPRYFMTVIEDTSEARELEQQLRQSQKLEAVGRLAGGVAHDFNNLLTVIAGHAELLQRELAPAQASSQEVAQILQTTRHARDLVRQLLTFARRDLPAPQVVDVSAEIGHAEKMLLRLLGAQVELRTAGIDVPHWVLIDPSQFQQVLMNLAINARDAMPDGGELRIEARRQHRDGRDEVVVTVADTGTGMSQETLERAFEPFFTTKPGGSGLGLSTCHGIVQGSGGRLDVESEPGRGATIEITWPEARAPDPLPASVPEPAAAPGTARETVLVVEDDESIRNLLARVLGQAGYEVLTAPDAHEALALGSETRFDLLLTDVVMPGMNGGDLVFRLRARQPTLRALLMSGYATDSLAGRIPEAVEFLAKPFTPEELLARVREALERATTAR